MPPSARHRPLASSMIISSSVLRSFLTGQGNADLVHAAHALAARLDLGLAPVEVGDVVVDRDQAVA